ncbi:MAG: GFA family protein [Proteobacteria bacterium]|nr:GFA family protein [Pseudomonadota bacterium]
MIEARCHCGAISVRVPGLPSHLIDCNCSICRKNGALWALYAVAEIEVAAAPGAIAEYVWGKRTIRTVHCQVCSATTHWLPVIPDPDARGGVNLRHVDPALRAGIRVRRFDGADRWEYLD